MALPQTLRRSVQRQASDVIRGQERPRPARFEQKHIWARYHFSAIAAGGAIQGGILQAADYTVFSAAASQGGQGLPNNLLLDVRDTNFPGSNGNIPAGYGYEFTEMGASIGPQRADVLALVAASRGGPPCPDDVDNLLNGVSIMFQKNNKVVNMGRLAWWTQAGGPVETVGSLIDYGAADGAVVGPPAYTTGGLDVGTSLNRQARWTTNSGGAPPTPATRRKMEVPLLLGELQQFLILLRVNRPITLKAVDQGGTLGFTIRLDFFGTESSPVSNT